MKNIKKKTSGWLHFENDILIYDAICQMGSPTDIFQKPHGNIDLSTNETAQRFIHLYEALGQFSIEKQEAFLSRKRKELGITHILSSIDGQLCIEPHTPLHPSFRDKVYSLFFWDEMFIYGARVRCLKNGEPIVENKQFVIECRWDIMGDQGNLGNKNLKDIFSKIIAPIEKLPLEEQVVAIRNKFSSNPDFDLLYFKGDKIIIYPDEGEEEEIEEAVIAEKEEPLIAGGLNKSVLQLTDTVTTRNYFMKLTEAKEGYKPFFTVEDIEYWLAKDFSGFAGVNVERKFKLNKNELAQVRRYVYQYWREYNGINKKNSREQFCKMLLNRFGYTDYMSLYRNFCNTVKTMPKHLYRK